MLFAKVQDSTFLSPSQRADQFRRFELIEGNDHFYFEIEAHRMLSSCYLNRVLNHDDPYNETRAVKL